MQPEKYEIVLKSMPLKSHIYYLYKKVFTQNKISKFIDLGKELDAINFKLKKIQNNNKEYNEIVNLFEKLKFIEVTSNYLEKNFNCKVFLKLAWNFKQLNQGVNFIHQSKKAMVKFIRSSITKAEGLNDILHIIYTVHDINKKESFFKITIREWHKKASNMINNFNAEEFTNAMWYFVNLKITPQGFFIKSWQNYIFNNLNALSAEQLSKSIVIASKFNIMLNEDFLNKWQCAAIKKLDEFNIKDINSAIHVFKLSKLNLLKDFLKIWEEKVDKIISNLSVNELHNFICELGHSQVRFSKKLENTINSEIFKNIDNFNEVQLSSCILSLAKLGIDNTTFQMLYYKLLSKNIEGQVLANTIYACRLANKPIEDKLLSIFKESKCKFNLVHFHQIYLSHIDYNFLSQELERVIKQYLCENFKAISSDSKLQNHIFKMIKHIIPEDQKVIFTALIEEGLFEVDVLIDDISILQIDGSKHFIKDLSSGKIYPSPQTEMNTRILENLGYIVHRISYEDIKYNSEKEIYNILEEYLNEAANDLETYNYELSGEIL